ncbi:hypothetical protein C8J57DRAFT_1129656 [Mycena rebaudengoi]|nr:hypothetical protein C8J57DRAFT_1129656 [Mycena rebaudengoi]
MANPSAPPIEIAGINDGSPTNLYFAVSGFNTEARREENTFDTVSDEAMRLKDEVSNIQSSSLYKEGIAIKDADAGHLVSKAVAAVSKFTENSEVIMKALDAVKQIHPFVGVVIVAFEAALKLEVERRKNDQKITALKTEMMNMVAILLDLRTIRDARRLYPDGKTLEGRMTLIATEAGKNIRDCIATCEKYIKKKFVVKLLDSFRWEERLAAFSKFFSERQKEFSEALSFHTALGVDNIQHMVGGIDITAKTTSDTASTLLLFQQLKTPRERELQKWIEVNGGAAVVLQNEKLFKQLQDKMKDIDDEIPGKDKNERTEALMHRISEEIGEDIDQALARDRVQFDRKFNAVQEQLEETKEAVHRGTDRILDEVKGPHERIHDKDLRAVWKDMAWRGSVKARHLIVAVQDYFLQMNSKEDQKMQHEIRDAEHGISRPGSPELSMAPSAAVTGERLTLPSVAVSMVLEERAARSELEDRWAIKYITLARLRPILEAFDDDASGWISIREANDFTTFRPPKCTVVKWLAFWASGFSILCARYAKQIENLRTHMVAISTDVLPFNRALIDGYMSNYSLDIIDWVVRDVLAGFDDHYDEDEALMSNFADYVKSEEDRLTKGLESFGWELDAYNTLQFIAGTGRIERHILPLIFLVLKRHTRVVQLACKQPLDDRELKDAMTSVDILVYAIYLRIDTLISNFRAQRLDPASEFDVAYNGMFKTVYLNFTSPDDHGELNWQYPETFVNLLDESDQEVLRYPPPVNIMDRDNSFSHRTVRCDSCGGLIIGARYKCLDCTVPATGNGVDLCEGCKDNSTFVAEKNLQHNPAAHALLKTFHPIYHRRRAVILIRANEQRQKATEIFAKAEKYPDTIPSQENAKGQGDEVKGQGPSNEDIAILHCLYCEKQVSRPCWSCIECEDVIFICDGCEKKQSEILQSGSNGGVPQDTDHEWHHVLLQMKEIEPEPPRVVDTPLAILERSFAEHESATRQKLASLEAAIEKLGDKFEMLGGSKGLLTQLLAMIGQ